MVSKMRELFNDILNMEGVKGLLFFSFSGDLIYKELHQTSPEELESKDWGLFIQALAGMREADLIFKKGRLYIRRTGIGYLIVLMGLFVPIAMMRLNCDIVMPALKPAKAVKGIRRFFKAK